MDAVRCTWIALAAAAALPLAPAPGGDSPTRTYRNPTYMISMKVFPDWPQVPIEISEKYEIARFYEPGSRGDMFRPSLEVFRLDRRGSAPVTGAGALDAKAREAARAAEAAPKSVFDLAFGRLGGSKPLDPKAFKKITSADKVDGKLWVFDIPYGSNTKDKSTTRMAGLAAFEKEGLEYGIFISGPARRGEDFERALKTIAKSFLFHDAKAKEPEALSVLDDVNISPRRRGEIQRGLIKGWGLEVSPKKNYVILYNTKGNKNRALARYIAERIEKIREQVYEVQFPPAHPITAVSIVRICGDRGEYHAYGGPGGSAGYWNHHEEELVFYDASPARKVDDDTLAVLYHEAFHQYIFYSVGNVAPHSWFNEGHGDYYAGSRYVAGKFKIGPFDWRVRTVQSAIREGRRPQIVTKDEKTGVETKRWSNEKGYTPLADLVAFSQRDYYSYPGVSYAQGWSLVYFLREAVPKKREWNAKWGGILDKYFNALKREVAKEGKLARGGERPDEPEPDGPTEPTEPTDPAGPTDPPADPADPAPPDEPGPGDGGGGTDEPAPDPGLQPMQEGEASENALQIALREAFEGVDFDELEEAWKEFTRKVRQ